MLSGVIKLVGGMFLGGITCWFLFLISSRLVWGIILMLMVFIIGTLPGKPSFQVGINVYPEDIVFLLLAVASTLRLSQISRINDINLVWLLYGGLLFFSFYQGITLFGTKAGIDFRSTFYYWVAVTYVMTFPATKENQNRISVLWGLMAVGLLFIAVYLWVSIAFGRLGLTHLTDKNAYRVLPAIQALFLASTLIGLIALYERLKESEIRKILIIILVIAIVVLSHRSVWVATAAALLTYFFLHKRKAAKQYSLGTIGTIIIGGLILSIIGVTIDVGSVINSIQKFSEEPFSSESTFSWRVQGYQELTKQWLDYGIVYQLFGAPFGTGYTRHLTVNNSIVDASPHNYYLQALLNVGIVGFAVWLYAYLATVYKIIKLRANSIGQVLENLNLILILLIAQMAYMLVYGCHYTQGIILGMAMSMAMNVQQESLPVKQFDTGI